jgi:starch synthase (maltosyl-transferring)
MAMASPVNKTTQMTDRVAAGGAFLIEDIYPSIDGGRFAVKRIAGEPVEVWADIYRGGEGVIAAALVWRRETDQDWQRVPMRHRGNDRWSAAFTPLTPGRHVYAIEAWTDDFATWRRDFDRGQSAGRDVTLDALEGAAMLTKAQGVQPAAAAVILRQCEEYLQTGEAAPLLIPELQDAMAESQWRGDLTRCTPMPLMVDRVLAGRGAWYAMVPRSQGMTADQHGTFKDCTARLPDVAAMGFDVIALAPIHPIGRTRRLGRDGAPEAAAGDPGNPYAIGSSEGGHDAVHPELGTLEDFGALVAASKALGIEVALEFAAQCSPDHPWLTQHPGWFRKRPDGAIRRSEHHADILTPDFGCADAGSLWNALRDVVLFWVDQGIRIFQVHEPHTAPLPFWQWLIDEVQLRHPDVIFLAAGFSRPKPMMALAKLGFTQSLSYFTWRTQKWELEQYLSELTRYPERDFYRANFRVSTLDILPYHLQSGEPWMFKSRLVLAATLSGNYGITGGFELMEHEAVAGKEAYADSEKYRIKVRDWDQADNLKPYIRALNVARRSNTALQQTANLRFVGIEDGNVIGFVKHSVDGANTVAVAVALTREPHEFWFPIGDTEVGTDGRHVAAIENLVTGERHPVEWGGVRLRIDPVRDPALLFQCLA